MSINHARPTVLASANPYDSDSRGDGVCAIHKLALPLVATPRKRDLTLKDLAAQLDLGITTVSDILLRGKTNYRARLSSACAPPPPPRATVPTL